MIIGVDAGSLSVSDKRLKVGVYRVTYNLLKELAKIDTENSYRLYSFAHIDREVMQAFGPNMENKVITPVSGWSSFWLPLELKRRPVDIFLGLSQALSDSTSHNIGFIYDLAFLYKPSAYGKSYFQLKKQTDNLVKRANHIITISEFSKIDILNHYQISNDRVSVCYPGVDERFTPSSPSRSQSPPGRWFEGDKHVPYFLFVGSLNKAKDLPLAIKSFALFLKKVKKPYDFLLVGGDYWPDPTINESIHRYHLETQVKLLGFVSDETLPAYYRGAVAFFTTAIREGFCLPAVESMACGTPVVSIDRGAMKEVVDDGGLISESIEPQKIAELLTSVATDHQLITKLKKHALDRATIFSWRKFAEYVMSMYP